jgi:c-di-GMP-binding flagellar brake protein YcgR
MSRLKGNNQSHFQSKMGVLSVERRKYPRYSVELPLSYSRVNDKDLFGGIVANASGGGVLVYLPERMEIGVVLKIEIFYLRGFELDTIQAVAKAVWSDLTTKRNLGEYRYGLEFQYIEKKDYNRLIALLKGIEN